MSGQNQTPFTPSHAGENQGSLSDGVLAVQGGNIEIAGYNNLSAVIPSIQSIELRPYLGDSSDNGYTNTIAVYGACPPGKTDNKMTFTDETGDTYTLRIYSDTASQHTVDYGSRGPQIVTITWDI